MSLARTLANIGGALASLTGLVKVNGSGVATPATPGVDYLAPNDNLTLAQLHAIALCF